MRFVLLALISFTFFSCQKALEKPENLLSKKEMTSILTEIYLYKQTPDMIPLSSETAFSTYVSIFKKHNTTKEIFQDSFNYYYTNPKTMQHIYDDVIDNLKDMLTKEQLQQLQNEEKEREEASKPKKNK